MKIWALFIVSILLCRGVFACALQNTSTVQFKMFSTETFLPMKKKEFKGERAGAKLVIDNDIFKRVLRQSTLGQLPSRFIEDIRMKVFYKGDIYFISRQGEIELDHKLIGRIDKDTRNLLDSGLGLYDWKTCKPFSEVLSDDIRRSQNLLH